MRESPGVFQAVFSTNIRKWHILSRERKEEIILSAKGYVQVRAFTSDALIPLKDAAITITDTSGAAIAMRLTNRNGLLDTPVEIPVPDRSASESPNTGVIPFSVIDLYARMEGYEEIHVEKLQVFADILTVQDLKMIPLSELPENWNSAEIFDTPPQNL